LYYFYEKLQETNSLLIYTTQDFWIIIAFLIYLSGTFFLYLYAENTLQDKQFQIAYATINSSFILLKNVLLSIAMSKKPVTPSSPSNFPHEDIMSDWTNIQSFKNVN